jgi:hypothetical protein
MAITITNLDPNSPISQGPATINQNFATVKTAVDALQALLNAANNTMKLTNLTTIPANSAEMSSLTLTAASGTAISLNPSGGSATFSLTFDGKISGLNITLTGTGVDKSVIADLDVNGAVAFGTASTVNANGKFLFRGTNSQLAFKYLKVDIVDANTGASATNPIDVSKEYTLMFNYDNSATPLANAGVVKLDTTNVEDGQILRIHCIGTNASGMKLYNGASLGNEIFAYIDPASNTFTSISHLVEPTFSPTASPNNQSFLEVQWINIGGGNFRFVILDSKNMTNVN